MTVEPLRCRTQTLPELQNKVLDLIQRMRQQLQKAPHEEGLTDGEFMDQHLAPFAETIRQDQYVEKMARDAPVSFEQVEESRQAHNALVSRYLAQQGWARCSNYPAGMSVWEKQGPPNKTIYVCKEEVALSMEKSWAAKRRAEFEAAPAAEDDRMTRPRD